jgi:lipid-A-disaccharide synthase-like uncharacterized protein
MFPPCLVAMVEGHVPDTFLEPYLSPYIPWMYMDSWVWMAIGLTGNLMFSSRFLIQWIVSEKNKQLTIPPIFWHLSFWGSLIALFYAFHVDKLPIILSYLFLPFINGRNLVLLYRGRRKESEPAPADANRVLETAGAR